MNEQYQVLVLIERFGSLATEKAIAKALYNGRVLPARAVIQQLLWSGIIVRCGVGYTLSEAARACYNVCVDRALADQLVGSVAMV